MNSNKLAGFRKIMGKTQIEMAEIFNISRQSYSLKEQGKTSFSDLEKIKFKEILKERFPEITIDEIFFN